MFDFLSKKFASVFQGMQKKKLTQADIQDALTTVTDALLEADVPHDLAKAFVEEVQQEAVGKKIITSVKPDEQFIKIVHDTLKQFLGGQEPTFELQAGAIVLVMGLQGSGKTTSIAKLAHIAKQHKNKQKILLASVDFYRPAAIDQLEQLAATVGVSFYRSLLNKPEEAAQDILQAFKRGGYDILFLDTAGRLHVDNTLLAELRAIKELVEPTHSLLVLDAMTGQESLQVAKAFDQAVGFAYAMLTKMDSDTRGGAAFSFRYALKKPILYVGIGEKPADIEVFKPERMAGRILDMGDVVSLVEKAEKQIQKEEQQSMQDALLSGKFSLDDFAKQMDMMGKLGSMSSLMKYLPGMGSLNISADMIQKGEQDLRKFRALIGSMTLKERKMPELFNPSRKARVAKGAGLQVKDLDLLLSRFEESKQYVKLLNKFARGQRFF